MSVLDRFRSRGFDLPPDDPLARRLTEVFGAGRIDPLFERRLRGKVLNRYVAAREGIVARPVARRQVGIIGRACLYASLAVVGSSAGALAASQSALPGDALYSVKLRIDEMRMQVAPADIRAEFAAYILGQRLDEAAVLAARGDWAGATIAAHEAEESAAQLAVRTGGEMPVLQAQIDRHLAVLAEVMADAPPEAAAALTHAIESSSHAGASAPGTTPSGVDDAAPGSGSQGGGTGNPGGGPGNPGTGNGAGGQGSSDDDSDGPPAAAPSNAPEAPAPPPPPSKAPAPGGPPGGDAEDSDASDTTPKPGRTPKPHATPAAAP